jgi:transposase
MLPANIILHPLPPYSPELNAQENIWDEIREKIFKTYALKSMDDVYGKLEEADRYIQRNPQNSQIHHILPLIRQVTVIWP